MQRRSTRQIKVRDVAIGGGAPISVQSMTNTRTQDVDATAAQIERLLAAGCEIVRVAIPNAEAADAFGELRERCDCPLVADIHFDYRLALRAAELGADKLRMNPGNIGERAKIEKVVAAATDRGIPIRVGVNAGSLELRLIDKYGGPTPAALCESALDAVAFLEELGFRDIVVSIKASDVSRTIEANRLFARETDIPLHLGITEAGLPETGIVKSAVGIGALLASGIGDTIRVSLTGDPVVEVQAGKQILQALGVRVFGPELIACPMCGRCEVDLAALAAEVRERLKGIDAPIRVAVMGCAVNGPGEAAEADVGIAGGVGGGYVFRKGERIGRLPEDQLVDALMAEVEKLVEERKCSM